MGSTTNVRYWFSEMPCAFGVVMPTTGTPPSGAPGPVVTEIDGVKRTGAFGSVIGAASASAGPKRSNTGSFDTAQRNTPCRTAPPCTASASTSVAPAASAPAACRACCRVICTGPSHNVTATVAATARASRLRRPRSASEAGSRVSVGKVAAVGA
ncbi:hypothetical protein D3C72_812990 [compost metagenome]